MALQMVFSHMSRILGTQAMLLAVGVGSKASLPLAAVTSWVLKDGLGHLVAIAFGTLINTRFDSDPKRYRFMAAVVGKFADMLSIFTLHWPQHFLVLSALSGACSRLGHSTYGSCRAKIDETFANSANLGDVLRCSAAQATAAQLLGTALGAALGPLVGANVGRLLAGNVLFSLAGMYFCYQSCTLVRMSTLNLQRAELLFRQAVDEIRQLRAEGRRPDEPGVELQLLCPAEVQEREAFVWPYKSVFPGVPLKVNPPLGASQLLLTPVGALQDARHLLAVEIPLAGATAAVSSRAAVRPSSALLWYCTGASPEDVARGFFHACLLRDLLAEAATPPLGAKGIREAVASTEKGATLSLSDAHALSETLLVDWWPAVAHALANQKWRPDVVFLDVKEQRVNIR